MSLLRKRKLIDIVEINPDLWKVTKKAPNLKQKLWNDVGNVLGISGFDARRQWEILRDQFRREYKRVKNDRAYVSKWIFYERMLFVRYALRPRDGLTYQSYSDNDEPVSEDQESNTVIVVEEKWNVESEIDDLPKIQVRQDLQEATNSSYSQIAGVEGEPSTSAGVSSSSQRPRYDEVDFSSNRRKRRWHAESPEDEDYHFVMSILPSLRSIQYKKKLRVRSKIMELIATELDAGCETEHHLPLTFQEDVRTYSDAEDEFSTEVN